MKYIVRYISTEDDDVCSVWTYANSKGAAEDYVRGEYWDIKEIISIVEAN